MPPKYPHVTVQLTGQNGNAFTILHIVRQALRKADISQSEIQLFEMEAMSGDYDHLLQTVMKTVATR